MLSRKMRLLFTQITLESMSHKSLICGIVDEIMDRRTNEEAAPPFVMSCQVTSHPDSEPLLRRYKSRRRL